MKTTSRQLFIQQAGRIVRPRKPSRIREAWRVVRGWVLYALLLDCEHCQGTALERWDGVWQPCSMCKGSGSQRQTDRQFAADQAALNAPPRCGCPECSREWDR